MLYHATVEDVENLVYSHVTSYVKERYPALANTISAMDAIPTVFPCVFLRQTGSYDMYGSMTSFHDRDPMRVVFTADVYSQAASGKKAEAKRLSKLVATAFKEIGFTRTNGSMEPQYIRDESDRVTAWITNRFEAVYDPPNGTFCTY